MNCIAVDDEPLALALLVDNISKVPFLTLVASCSDAFAAMQALQENKIDLVFIDIQMPGLTGLQFIGSLEIKPMVIFITAYKQYAVESYDLAVVDYLVKPVALERFIKACNRVKELHELKTAKQQSPAPPALDYFFVHAGYSQVKVIFADIVWLEGLGDYIKIHLKSSKKPLVVRTSLKAIDSELPSGKFIRIHKSYVVAIPEIAAVRKNSVFLHEIDKGLPIGETYREEVEKFLRNER